MGRRTIKSTQKSQQKSLFTLPDKLLSHALELLTGIYMLVVIVALPLYNKRSYAQIGTDKRTFFNDYLLLHSKALILLLLLYLSIVLIRFLWKQRKDLSFAFLKKTACTIWKQLTLTDKFMIAYAISVFLAAVFTEYKDLALLGSLGWTMGTLMQFSLVSGYFLISRTRGNRMWIIMLLLPVSLLLFLLGYCNRFGLWPIAFEYSENPQFLSLAGNINWYCGYLVTVLFGAVYLHWADCLNKTWQNYLLRLYLFIGFATLVTNGSSSGILSLGGAFLVLFLLSVSDSRKMKRFFDTLFLFSLSCLFTWGIRHIFPDAITYQESTNNLFTYTILPFFLMLFSLSGWFLVQKASAADRYPLRAFRFLGTFTLLLCILLPVLYLLLLIRNTTIPGSIGALSAHPLFTFSVEWGSRRGATWMAGWMAYAEQPFLRKLIGVGPDCMAAYLYRDSSSDLLALLQTVWPSTTLSNAHNEWLTILVNLGILGFISFVGLILSAIISFLKTGIRSTSPYAPLIGACGLSVLAYTLNNFVSFQQVLNEPVMFVILGIGAAYCRRS